MKHNFSRYIGFLLAFILAFANTNMIYASDTYTTSQSLSQGSGSAIIPEYTADGSFKILGDPNSEENFQKFLNGETVSLESLIPEELTYSTGQATTDTQGSLSTFSTTDSDITFYANQLSDTAKNVYDQVIAHCTPNANGIATTMDGTSSFTVTLDTPIAYSDYTSDNVYGPFLLIHYENPEIFWLNVSKLSVSASTSNGKVIAMTYSLGSGYSDYLGGLLTSSNVPTYYKQLMAKRDEVLADLPTTSRYDQLKYLNNWLCENNTYNKYVSADTSLGANYPLAQTALCAMLWGLSDDAALHPVCASYALALKFLCNGADIPCEGIISATHMWNYVKMDDGKWYVIDVTWNDPTVGTTQAENMQYRTQYFLLGSKSQVGSYIFCEEPSHVETALSVAYPTVSEYSYSTSSDDDIDASWYSNNPSASYYVINTPKQLMALPKICNGTSIYGIYNFSGKTIYIGSNIDMSGLSWTPIGTSGNTFSGTIDGCNNTISNLTLDSAITDNSAGFVSKASGATVKNITISNPAFNVATTTGSYVTLGGIIGAAYNSTVDNAHITGGNIVNSVAYSTSNGVGGIVAYNYNTNINRCSVEDTYISGTYGVGSIAGVCYNTSSSTAKISNCYNTGTVEKLTTYTSTSGMFVGALVGVVSSEYSTIDSCYNLGTSKAATGSTGGLVCLNYGTVKNCYNAGTIVSAGGYYAAAIVTLLYGGSVENCYYLDTIKNSVYNPNSCTNSVTAVSSANLMASTAASNLGSNFVYSANSYPRLSWEGNSVEVSTFTTEATTETTTVATTVTTTQTTTVATTVTTTQTTTVTTTEATTQPTTVTTTQTTTQPTTVTTTQTTTQPTTVTTTQTTTKPTTVTTTQTTTETTTEATTSAYSALSPDGSVPDISSTSRYTWSLLTINGVLSATSGNTYVGGTSSTMTIKFSGKGTISLKYMVSSEEDYDYLTITDLESGTDLVDISGETSWATLEKTYTTNTQHTLTVTYSKDYSYNDGDDCGYISTVIFTPAGVLGDANGDGTVTISDVTAIAKSLVGAATIDALLADYNKDGDVTIADALAIAKMLAGLN